jgi:hypothetical protein
VDTAFAHVHLAAGDAAAASEPFEAARNRTGLDLRIASTLCWASLALLACGDLIAARRWADDVVAVTNGCGRSLSLTARAYVEIAQGEPDTAAGVAEAWRSDATRGAFQRGLCEHMGRGFRTVGVRRLRVSGSP